MPTVWIVSDSGHDYSTAKKFGEVSFLYNDKINVFASDKLVKELCAKLQNSNKNDCVLPSGNSLATCLTFSILMSKHSMVNMLIYSFRNQMYEVRTILKSQFVLFAEEDDNVGNRISTGE